MGARRRLERLEASASKGLAHEIPLEVLILLKAVAGHQARKRGEDPPDYTQEEIETLRQDDLEAVAGLGTVGRLRNSAGWTSPEALEHLEAWEEDARRRLASAEGLPPERWGEVWGADEETEDDEDGGIER